MKENVSGCFFSEHSVYYFYRTMQVVVKIQRGLKQFYILFFSFPEIFSQWQRIFEEN